MSKSKDTARQADISRQREEVLSIGQQFLSQLIPGSPEFNELQAAIQRYAAEVASPADEQGLVRDLGSRLVQTQQGKIASGAPATPLEARTQIALEGLRGAAAPTTEEADLGRILRGESPSTPFGTSLQSSTRLAPEEEALRAILAGTPATGSAGQIFGQVVQRAQDPSAAYHSTLDPALQQALDAVDAQMGRRGIGGQSGLRLEALGRAGVDAAIQEAQQREAFRSKSYQDYLQLLDRAEQSRQASQQDFRDVFNVNQQLRGRQLGVEGTALELQSGRENRLTDLLNTSSFNRGTQQAELLARRTTSAEEAATAAADAEAKRRAAIMQAIGQTVGFGAGAMTGNPMLAFQGAQLGGALAGGGAPSTAAGHLNAQRADTSPSMNLGSRLSLQAGGGDTDNARMIDAILRSQYPQRRGFFGGF